MSQTLLTGLVLVGGESSRMGSNKALVTINDKTLLQHSIELLSDFVSEILISCKEVQVLNYIDTPTELVTDDKSFGAVGPAAGIMSAMQKKPHCSFVVMACDHALTNKNLLATLVTQRNVSAEATAFKDPTNPRGEPLFAIYEARAYEKLYQKSIVSQIPLYQTLRELNTHWVNLPHSKKIINLNTQGDIRAHLGN